MINPLFTNFQTARAFSLNQGAPQLPVQNQQFALQQQQALGQAQQPFFFGAGQQQQQFRPQFQPQQQQPQGLQMMNFMLQMMGMMMQMVQQLSGGGQVPGQPGPYPTPGPAPAPGPYPVPTPGPTPTPTPVGNDGTKPYLQTNADDTLDYILAQTRGGTSGVNEAIEGRYARPGSRLATAGANEFDAAIVSNYAAQFKAFALGKDPKYDPGVDTVQQIASNINQAQQVQFTPEAELLSKVAAVYRGELTGSVNTYDNNALRNVLLQFNRGDIASLDGVGQFDVQSIGGVVKMLNEEQDPAIRQQMLQQVFDFQGNSPSSPSGAVPQLGAYQRAIDLVRNGTVEGLLNNYANGVKTNQPLYNGPANPNGEGVGPIRRPDLDSAAIDKNIDFQTLNTDQRTAAGLSDRDRAILHMYGRQMISQGFQDGGIYTNVLDNNTGTDAEKSLITELRARDRAQFGVDTGVALDEEFFALHKRLTGEDLSTKYANRQVHQSQGAINIINDLDKLQEKTGLTTFEQALFRLYGHEPLLNGGKIDGSSLAYTIANANALDSNAKSGGNGIDAQARKILELDIARDGIVNGDALNIGFVGTLDKLYLGGSGVTEQSLQQTVMNQAAQLGRTAQQVSQDVAKGVDAAIGQATQLVADHPVSTVAGAGGLAAAIAVCPFLGGLGASGVAATFGGGQEAQPAQQAGGVPA